MSNNHKSQGQMIPFDLEAWESLPVLTSWLTPNSWRSNNLLKAGIRQRENSFQKLKTEFLGNYQKKNVSNFLWNLRASTAHRQTSVPSTRLVI
jgi:hypothetical protein